MLGNNAVQKIVANQFFDLFGPSKLSKTLLQRGMAKDLFPYHEKVFCEIPLPKTPLIQNRFE